jgi:hypothetical protein
MIKVLAVVFVVLALVVGIVPQFTNCQADGKALTLASGKQVAMKCLWTARASIAIALPLAAVGVMLFFARRKETQRMLAVMGGVLGAGAILLPTSLIGVCAMEAACRDIMKPLLIAMGALAVVAAILVLVRPGGQTPAAA